VYEASGRPVVSVGQSRIVVSEKLAAPDSVELGELQPDHGDVEIVLRAPLILNGVKVGALEVVQGVDEIEHVTGDYTGLEETGEAYVVMRGHDGDIVFLHGLRHEGLPDRRLRRDRAGVHVEAALDGEEAVFLRDIVDYRGEPVWAATRTLPITGLGLVVKLDAAEAWQKTERLRTLLRDLSFALAAFAILGGALLGSYLARPIRELAEVVGRIRDGEVDLRADARGEDEVGFLGRAINELLDDRKRGSALPPRDDLD
jgi:HAMP domain-containing protein